MRDAVPSTTEPEPLFLTPTTVTTTQPRIGTLARLNGTSYAVMMIDLDIPTDSPPQTNTLLHWMQTGLTPSTVSTQLNTTSGPIRAFLLENRASTAAVAPYFGPNPPARVPLSHRYTQVLVDTSALTDEGLQALRAAAGTARGFDAGAALAGAGLEGRIVAGNSYNVTNPGPALAPNATGTGTGTGNGNGNGTATATAAGGGGGGGGGASETGASQTVVPGAGVMMRPGSALVGGLGVVGLVMLGL